MKGNSEYQRIKYFDPTRQGNRNQGYRLRGGRFTTITHAG